MNWDVVQIGETRSFDETITAELIRDYAELLGDHHRLHADAEAEYNSTTVFGRPIAHGAILVGLMSRASTILSYALEDLGAPANVSLGYNRIRFPNPVYAGDRVTTKITVTEKQEDKGRVLCEELCTNQDGEVVGVGEHIMRFI